MNKTLLDFRSAGYAYLMEKYAISGVANWHRSSVSSTGAQSLKIQNGFVDEVFRSQYWPGEKVGDHLEFALKYDGVNLGLLAQIFKQIPQEEITQYIQSKPTGKYARRIWFFYEFITGEQLPIDNLSSGNYVKVLDEKKYYTLQNGDKSPRHRIVNNLLGDSAFCPIIRRTDKLEAFDVTQLQQKCEALISAYPPELLRRALSYLYNKETKSSFAIENITPSASRVEKFIAALELAEKEDFCHKEGLIALQNRIVDPRFRDSHYRTSQNYVGQTVAYQKEIIHFIPPKPEDLPSMMEGLIKAHHRMTNGHVSPIVHAAAIAYGFVFLHPFEDGNGRIHRFLIHNIFSLRKMVPKGLMFPISAVMLENPADYDASLEAFSKPLLELIDYEMDEMGQMRVKNDTAYWYQYMDMTVQAEALQDFVMKTIEEELVKELGFLVNYDKTKKAIQQVIDMPDRMIDLFIKLCSQNNGTLSARKRAAYFDFLTDKELASMEQIVQSTQ